MAGQSIVISVLADTKKLSSGLKEAGGMLSGIGGLAKTGAKVAVGAIAGIGAAVGGLAIAGGISRALNIDTAQTKLKALGYDAKEMEGIMDSALESVRGTSYGLGDAATLASQALAAGIPQGEELTKSLTLVTNTAALAGVGLGDMGSIFSKVWTSGRVGTQELNQLADRGIPIWTTLADSLGVGVDELRKMVSAGEVTTEMFTTGLGPAVDGIAGTMGTSFKGMVSNLQAALGRMGALFAGPAIEHMKPWIGFFTESIDKISSMLGPLADRFDAFLGNLAPPENLDDLFSGLDPSALIDGLASAISGAAEWLSGGGLATIFGAIINAREGILNAALAAFPGIVDALVAITPQVVAGLATLVTQLVAFLSLNASSLLTAAVVMLTGLIGGVAQVLPGVIAAIVGTLPSLVESVLAVVPDILDAAITLFTAIVDALPVVIPPLIAAIVETLPVLIETILGMIPAILDGAVSLFTALVEAIPVIVPLLISALIKLIPTIITTVLNMLPKLLEAAVRLFTGIVTAIPKIIPKLIPALLSLIPQIVGTLIGMIPKLIKAGMDLIGGLVKGLWQAAGSVGSALLDIAKNAIGGFLSFLGIKSPSRLFAGYGRNLVEGLAGGLDKNRGLFSNSLDNLAGMASAFNPEPLSVSPVGTLTSATVASRVDAPASTGTSATPGMVELSPYDRQLLAEIRDNIGITITERSLQGAVNGGNLNAAHRRAA